MPRFMGKFRAEAPRRVVGTHHPSDKEKNIGDINASFERLSPLKSDS